MSQAGVSVPPGTVRRERLEHPPAGDLLTDWDGADQAFMFPKRTAVGTDPRPMGRSALVRRAEDDVPHTGDRHSEASDWPQGAEPLHWQAAGQLTSTGSGRRTVVIEGRGSERSLAWRKGERRRPPRPAHHRPGFKPDRMAMWAVLLGLLLVLVAATSAHAATSSRARNALQGATAAPAVAASQRTPARAPSLFGPNPYGARTRR